MLQPLQDSLILILFDWSASRLINTPFMEVQIGTTILENFDVSAKLKYTILAKSSLASFILYFGHILSPTGTSAVLF